MKDLAPIALFCFNRPIHLKKTLSSLKKNLLFNKSKIYIFADGAKTEKDLIDVDKVRNLVKNLKGFKKKKIIFRKKNFGLAKNIISGVNYVLKKEKKIIVLEDDLITSKFFLSYMNKSLDYYKKENKVASIHGYIYPLNKKNLLDNFFIKGADCWGWGTWKRSWMKFEKKPEVLIKKIKKKNLIREFNFNNTKNYFQMLKKNLYIKNKSWAIQWYASAFLKNMYTLYPKYTYVKNIGLDGSGKNTKLNYNLNSNFPKKYQLLKINDVKEDVEAKKSFEEYFKSNEKNFIEKIYFKIFNE
jgi:hypothetical protein